MPERRAWALALGALSAILLGAAIAAVTIVASLTEEVSGGVSYTGADDPVFIEWVRLQSIMGVLSLVGPPLAIAAGLSVAMLLFVLARRWDARFSHVLRTVSRTAAQSTSLATGTQRPS